MSGRGVSRRHHRSTGTFKMRMTILTTICLIAAASPLAAGELPQTSGNWPFYAGDAGGSRYSALDQINTTNVAQLKPAWEIHTGDVSDGSDGRSKSEFETTPIVIGGTMYLTTPFNRVLALDPETGRERWNFDPKIDLHQHYSEGLVNRGVAFWPGSAGADDGACHQRIFLAKMP